MVEVLSRSKTYQFLFQDPMIYVEILNELPIDLTLTLNSTAFTVTEVLNFPTNETTIPVSQEVSLLTGSSGVLDMTLLTAVDFAVDITSPGYVDGNPPTLSMIVPTAGATYNFSGTVGLYSDDAGTPAVEDYDNPLTVESVVIENWSYAGIMPEDYDGTNGLDLGSYFSELDEMVPGLNPQVGASAISAYLNVNLPTELSVDMYVNIQYDDSEGTPIGPIELIATQTITGQKTILFPDNVFEGVINNRATNMVINYDASIAGQSIDVGANAEETKKIIVRQSQRHARKQARKYMI